MINIHEIITDSKTLSDRYIIRNNYVFTAITHPGNIYDAIVIKNPRDAKCCSPTIISSVHDLEEHINFINENKIEKALIIADDIHFITRCPSLKFLKIIPSNTSQNGFDYSPLYKMPQIKHLQCSTVYGVKNELSASVDCSRINGLESIGVTNNNYENYNTVKSLKKLGISNYRDDNLCNAFSSTILDTLTVIGCKITSLEGIQKSEAMQCVYLHYNYSLRDISALKDIKNTLKALRIENCAKINDFSVLEELENLELLELSGSNELPSLSFIKAMKNLKTFVFSVNVKDGDLSPTLGLSYVYSEKNRKHYNIKDANLPKGAYVRGNESIELWRRVE